MNSNESPRPAGPARSSRKDDASNMTQSRPLILSPGRASARSGYTMASRFEGNTLDTWSGYVKAGAAVVGVRV